MKTFLTLFFVLTYSFAAIGEEADTPVEAPKASGLLQHSKDKQSKPLFNFFLSAGTGIMRGNTTYQIGGHYSSPEGSGDMHFPISELIFPLEVYAAKIKGGVEYKEKWRFETTFKKNLTKKTGNMKDSDWGVPWEDSPGSGTYSWYGPDHLDIYSESKTELDAYILDVEFAYKFFQKSVKFANLSLYGGIGYRHQNYYFECRLIRQWDYREAAPPGEKMDAVGDGRVGLTYDITTYIPYFKIAPQFKKDNLFTVETGLGISPYTKIKDKDNHILRSKISKAECTGYTLLLSLDGRLDIFDPVFIGLSCEYIFVDTEGEQKQYTNGAWTATIEQKNFSRVGFVELFAGCVF